MAGLAGGSRINSCRLPLVALVLPLLASHGTGSLVSHGSLSSLYPRGAGRRIGSGRRYLHQKQALGKKDRTWKQADPITSRYAGRGRQPLVSPRSGPGVDSGILQQQMVVLSTFSIIGGYWWLVLVPSERQRLSKNKKSGELAEYLQDLKKEQDERPLESWLFDKWLRKIREPRSGDQQTDFEFDPTVMTRGDYEREKNALEVGDEDVQNEDITHRVSMPPSSTFSSTSSSASMSNDNISNDESPEDRRQQEKLSSSPEPTLQEILTPPKLKSPKFWSFDNPVVVATSVLIGVGLFSTLLQRLSSH